MLRTRGTPLTRPAGIRPTRLAAMRRTRPVATARMDPATTDPMDLAMMAPTVRGATVLTDGMALTGAMGPTDGTAASGR